MSGTCHKHICLFSFNNWLFFIFVILLDIGTRHKHFKQRVTELSISNLSPFHHSAFYLMLAPIMAFLKRKETHGIPCSCQKKRCKSFGHSVTIESAYLSFFL